MNLNMLKKTGTRGLIYAMIALAGLIFELFFSKEMRSFLIVMYPIVMFIGLFYFFRGQK